MDMTTQTNTPDIFIEPTPNPHALKFVTSLVVKNDGKASFKRPEDCENIPLAFEIFKLRGVDQVHFFGNVITVSKFSFEDWEGLEDTVIAIIKQYLPFHDPAFIDKTVPVAKGPLASLPELKQIEEILDRTIRPGLQGDGGDLEALSYENNILLIKFQGACGSCPSSLTGTLDAIRGILREEFNPQLEVMTAPA